MVAHETVHVLQKGRTKQHLINASISEGVADFIPKKFLNLNINSLVHSYGIAHECEFWTKFKKDIDNDPGDYTKWLYNGSKVVDRPADLGYFIGYRIAESYYNNAIDKEAALSSLLKRKMYKKIYKQSGYDGNCNK